jgi:hypothetical protein
MRGKERVKRATVGTMSALRKELTRRGGEAATASAMDLSVVESIIGDWGAVPEKAARDMIERYGAPNEATPSRLIWFNNGPWKRTMVYRDEVPHNFPKPHTDVLEQFVEYRVPVDKYAEIAAFDGSVIPERTKGEVSARCDMEPMNILALNLMHDIVTGRRGVEDARRFYADAATAFMMSRPSPYAEKLNFDTHQDGTADLDQALIAAAMTHQAKEKVQDVTARH